VAILNDAARALIDSGALAHLVTLNADGSPQVTCIWVGLEGDEIVAGHLFDHRKLQNIRRDARVAISFQTAQRNAMDLDEYLVVYGTARIVEGGGPEVLQRLARVYFGDDRKFPAMDDPPPGFTTRIAPQRVTGAGPWRD
jgi:PPOX class probable F420-dependent enzyme